MADPRPLLNTAVGLSGLGFGAAGLALVFAPQEAAETIGLSWPPLPLQLLGAALAGVGVMNWTIRSAPVGGIYGKAVVAGNQIHLVVGAIALVKQGVAAGGTAAFWALTALYAAGAILFVALLFTTSGTKRA